MKAKTLGHTIISHAFMEVLNNEGKRRGLTKPYDLAITILTDLDRAGLQLSWKKGKKPNTKK